MLSYRLARFGAYWRHVGSVQVALVVIQQLLFIFTPLSPISPFSSPLLADPSRLTFFGYDFN